MFARFKDKLRSLLGIRVRRQLPEPGPLPKSGDHLARGDIRMRIIDDIQADLWDWLTARGWRKIQLASDRRRYRVAQDEYFEELLNAEHNEDRELIERRLMASAVITEFERKRRAVSIYSNSASNSSTRAVIDARAKHAVKKGKKA